MGKIATSDGYVIQMIPAAVGDPAEVRRRVVAGTEVPDWLLEEGNDVQVKLKDDDKEEPLLKHQVYMLGGEEDPPRDPDTEPTPLPAEDDELAAEEPAHKAPAKKSAAKKD